MKTLLFKIAHKVKNSFNSFSEALSYAWKVIKLRMKMTKDVVSFRFKKVYGSIREAVGTLAIKYTYKTESKVNYSVFTYFDIEKQEFRSAKVESLIF